MKKKELIFISIICIILLTGCENTVTQQSNIPNNNQRINIRSNDNPQYIDTQDDSASLENNQPKTSQIISSFSTKIYDTSKGRMNNLRLASQKLSNITIQNEETFSFNDNIGPYSKDKGYEKAKIFDSDGDVLQEYGGGICQISSTLYNCVLQLDFEILERHNHSNKVQYIELGKDAAISYGHLDLVFKNTLDYPINIQCKVENDQVIVDIIKEE